MIKVKFDNVNFSSPSGPNGFGLKLARCLFKTKEFNIVDSDPDIQLSFIEVVNSFNPCILRLDGIYFNNKQDWGELNYNIEKSYASNK